MTRASHEKVKVVLIDTHYVVTDPMSFKSVVQRYTGKESSVSWIEESSFTGAERKGIKNINGGVLESSSLDNGYSGGFCGGDWGLSKSMSFKDLSRIMSELPPVDEWQRFWAQDNL